MKKVFYFTVFTALILTQMFSCKSKNDPNSPGNPENQSGTQEWFDKWMEGDKEDQVEIKEENLYGIWQLAGQAITHEDSVAPLGGNSYLGENRFNGFVEIKKGKTYIDYSFDNGSLTKNNGTWELNKKKLYFVSETSNSGWGTMGEEYKIHVLEADRLVLCRPYDDEMTQYYAYIRIDKLPEFPLTTEEKLVANAWRVVSDSVFKRGAYDKVIELYKDELLPKNSVLKFNSDYTLTVKEAEGKLLGACLWAPRQDLGSGFLLLDVLNTDGFMISGEFVIPGLCNDLLFRCFDNGKAYFEDTESLPEKDAEGVPYEKVWRYHVEAVK